MVFIWIPPSKAPKEVTIKNIEKSVTKISQDFSVLKLLYFCQIKVQIEITILLLSQKVAVVWIVRAPAVKWPILNSLPSNSYYQLKDISNSVIRLKSPTESKKDNLTKPSQCIVHILITVRSFFIVVFFPHEFWPFGFHSVGRQSWTSFDRNAWQIKSSDVSTWL